jgi:hypothetical protein
MAEIAEAIGEVDGTVVVLPPDSCVVPGTLGFSAADASNATTPSRTDDATRRVRSWPIRLDDVPLDDLKIDNLPMHQIWQFTSKTEPTETQLQPNSGRHRGTVNRTRGFEETSNLADESLDE